MEGFQCCETRLHPNALSDGLIAKTAEQTLATVHSVFHRAAEKFDWKRILDIFGKYNPSPGIEYSPGFQVR